MLPGINKSSEFKCKLIRIQPERIGEQNDKISVDYSGYIHSREISGRYGWCHYISH